jgi:hypothetical protein
LNQSGVPEVVDEVLLTTVYQTHCRERNRHLQDWLEVLTERVQQTHGADTAIARIDASLRESQAISEQIHQAQALFRKRETAAVWSLLSTAFAYRTRLRSAERLYQHAVAAERLAGRLATYRAETDLNRFGATVAALWETLEALRQGTKLEQATLDLSKVWERAWDQLEQTWEAELVHWLESIRTIPLKVTDQPTDDFFPWPGIYGIFCRCSREQRFLDLVIRLTTTSIHRQVQADTAMAKAVETIERLLSSTRTAPKKAPVSLCPWALIQDAHLRVTLLADSSQVEQMKWLAIHLPSTLKPLLDRIGIYCAQWQHVMDASIGEPHPWTGERLLASALPPALDDASTTTQTRAATAISRALVTVRLYDAALSPIWGDLTNLLTLTGLELVRLEASMDVGTLSEFHTSLQALYDILDTQSLQLLGILRRLLDSGPIADQPTSVPGSLEADLLEAASKLMDLALSPVLVALYHAGTGLLSPELCDTKIPESSDDSGTPFPERVQPDERAVMTLHQTTKQLDALRQRFGQRPAAERRTGISAAIGLIAQMSAAMARLRRLFCARQGQLWDAWLQRDHGLCLYGTLLPSLHQWLAKKIEPIAGALHSLQELIKPPAIPRGHTKRDNLLIEHAHPDTIGHSTMPKAATTDHPMDHSLALQTVFEVLHELASWALDMGALMAKHMRAVERLRERHRRPKATSLRSWAWLDLLRAAEVERSSTSLAVHWALARDADLGETYFANLSDSNHPLQCSMRQVVGVVAPAMVESLCLAQSLVLHRFDASLHVLEATSRCPPSDRPVDYDSTLDLPAFSVHPSDAVIALGERLLALPSQLEPLLLATPSALHLRCLTLESATAASEVEVWAAHLGTLAHELYRNPETLARSLREPVSDVDLSASARFWLPLLVESVANAARLILQQAPAEALSDEQQQQRNADRDYLDQVLKRMGC